MGNNIQIFQNAQFGNIRMLQVNNEPYFVGSDIATSLGYSNTRDAISKHVDEDDRGVSQIATPYGEQTMTIINESGVYSLIMSSKLPQAKQFKKWVTSEVLPTIRKHGAYMSDQIIERTLNDPDYLIQLATTLKQEKQARLEAEAEAKQKQMLLDIQRPKVAFAEAIVGSKNAILIRDLAKIISSNGIKMGQNRLFGWLREHKYLNDYNEPYQRYVEQGLFIRVEHAVDHGGEMVTHFTTKVPGKGQQYFVNKILIENEQIKQQSI